MSAERQSDTHYRHVARAVASRTRQRERQLRRRVGVIGVSAFLGAIVLALLITGAGPIRQSSATFQVTSGGNLDFAPLSSAPSETVSAVVRDTGAPPTIALDLQTMRTLTIPEPATAQALSPPHQQAVLAQLAGGLKGVEIGDLASALNAGGSIVLSTRPNWINLTIIVAYACFRATGLASFIGFARLRRRADRLHDFAETHPTGLRCVTCRYPLPSRDARYPECGWSLDTDPRRSTTRRASPVGGQVDRSRAIQVD